MKGTVTARREATVEIRIKAPRKRSRTVRAVVDTGFTESLALPRQEIDRLGLRARGSQRIVLADGTRTTLDVYTAVVRWQGVERLVPAIEVKGAALLGMALLHGSRLTLDAVPDGPVRIEPLA